MRITLEFLSESKVTLPIHYNELIHGFLYNHLDKVLASFLHEEGYKFEKRKYPFFTFSRILGKARIKENLIEFSPPLKIVISSPLEKILRSLAKHLLRAKEIKIGKNPLYLNSITVGFKPNIKEEMKIRMLSPVTVYSTLKTGEGKKKTYFYNPQEKEFSFQIKNNLIKKYMALKGEEPSETEFDITPLTFKKENEKIVKFKGFTIKGWMGKYLIKGAKDLLLLAYDSGIGAKNSLGFGCFEII